jgi:hypothetical protein
MDAVKAVLLFIASQQQAYIHELHFISGNTVNLKLKTHILCMVFEAFATECSEV